MTEPERTKKKKFEALELMYGIYSVKEAKIRVSVYSKI